jgi:probable F420-dependent oxidoreductase
MKITLLHPLAASDCHPALLAPPGIARFARAADEAGFDALAFTEHPAPPQKWLDTGGHGSLDPFAALAFSAAVTERIRLMTYLLVLPYRSPLVTLKAATTVDHLSDGRLTLTVGNGYLASEFRNLGLDFDNRVQAFDDALDVLKAGWGEATLNFDNERLSFKDVALSPTPRQSSLPILIGGNSGVARRRAARVADGWSPLVSTPERSARNRMAAITSVEELRVAVAKMRETATEAGRDADALFVQTDFPLGEPRVSMTAPRDEHLALLSELADAGIQSLVVRAPGDNIEKSIDVVRAYGEDVLPHI